MPILIMGFKSDKDSKKLELRYSWLVTKDIDIRVKI